ncbi:MAG: hypothetical protein AAFZ17_13695 [Cyanobacteria bacterium J06650_10]
MKSGSVRTDKKTLGITPLNSVRTFSATASEWVVLYRWGRITALQGQSLEHPCGSYEQGLEILSAIENADHSVATLIASRVAAR